MNVIFKTRDFLSQAQPDGLEFKVRRYSFAAMGGPKAAEIEATGGELALWQLADLLRCPVEIDNDTGAAVWWGYVNEVEIMLNRVKVTFSLDDMANRVALAYEEMGAGETSGVRETTAWADDAESQAIYGVKEILDSSDGTTATHAAADRDRLLQERKLPVMSIEGATGKRAEYKATLYCRGWWDTLEYKYCNVPLSLGFAYETARSTSLDLGSGASGYQKVDQSFRTGANTLNAASVGLYLSKIGAPADTVTVAIYSDSDAGFPGASLASGSLDASETTTDNAWVSVPLDSEYELAANTTYYLQVGRSGADDSDNYFVLPYDNLAGYALGDLYASTDSASTDYSTITGDLPLRLYTDDIIETSQQVYSMLVMFGQFFRRVVMDIDSGISTESYRDGDGDAQFEVEKLLEMGTTDNVRMLASVDIGRTVTVYEEPGETLETHYRVNKDFSLYDAYGAPLDKTTCPCAVWVRLGDVIPPGVGTQSVVAPATLFIEESEYNAASGELVIRPRGRRDVTDVESLRDG